VSLHAAATDSLIGDANPAVVADGAGDDGVGDGDDDVTMFSGDGDDGTLKHI